MLNKFKRFFSKFSGWRTKRKIIVIESDDWGSIRMPNKKVYFTFLKKGYPVDHNAYERFDSLASEEDLQLLFDVLAKYKDQKGRHPIITANVIMGNPNFEKIKNSGFEEYHFEHFTETLKKYPKHQKSFDIWKVGMREGFFYPQYHGREHVNVSLFLKALQRKEKAVHFGFKHQMPGSIPIGLPAKGNPFVEATRYNSEQDKWDKLSIYLEGYQIFTETFGFKSKTVMPPNYLWSPDYDEKAAKAGIEFYQAGLTLKSPNLGGKKTTQNIHYLGEKNRHGQRYLIRNAVFEPSLFNQNIKDPVGNCINQIGIAFAMKKPAIISSHRINFIGYLDESNRDKNLVFLDELIRRILKKWPEVEFIHSERLAELIESSSND